MKNSHGGVLQSSNNEDTLSNTDSSSREGGDMIDLTSTYLLVEVPFLDEGCEDGLSLSRRSVLTEKLPPATRTPVPRKRVRRVVPRELDSFDSLPV